MLTAKISTELPQQLENTKPKISEFMCVKILTEQTPRNAWRNLGLLLQELLCYLLLLLLES